MSESSGKISGMSGILYTCPFTPACNTQALSVWYRAFATERLLSVWYRASGTECLVPSAWYRGHCLGPGTIEQGFSNYCFWPRTLMFNMSMSMSEMCELYGCCSSKHDSSFPLLTPGLENITLIQKTDSMYIVLAIRGSGHVWVPTHSVVLPVSLRWVRQAVDPLSVHRGLELSGARVPSLPQDEAWQLGGAGLDWAPGAGGRSGTSAWGRGPWQLACTCC